MVIPIKYTAVFSVFMCWGGEWNGSEDYEEAWNRRMVVIMEKLQRKLCFKK
jgi:hypothetical protein